jgi:hypothetical protein
MAREGSTTSLDSADSSNSGSITTSRRISETSMTTEHKGPHTIRPKGEWVLPARAKPGRKPSEVEPPTVSGISLARAGYSDKRSDVGDD